MSVAAQIHISEVYFTRYWCLFSKKPINTLKNICFNNHKVLTHRQTLHHMHTKGLGGKSDLKPQPQGTITTNSFWVINYITGIQNHKELLVFWHSIDCPSGMRYIMIYINLYKVIFVHVRFVVDFNHFILGWVMHHKSGHIRNMSENPIFHVINKFEQDSKLVSTI